MKKIIIVASLITISVIAFIAVISSSKKPVFEKQNVFPGVHVKVKIDKVATKKLMGRSYSFVYFKYTIQNQYPKKIFFHPGNIRVKYNGLKNQSVEYNSLASAMTEAEELPIGTKEYALCFVFNKSDVGEIISQFEILNTGLGFEKVLEERPSLFHIKSWFCCVSYDVCRDEPG
jgi:hypothetical protein